MPGPCNSKRKKKLQFKKQKNAAPFAIVDNSPASPPPRYEPVATVNIDIHHNEKDTVIHVEEPPDHDFTPHTPNIYDPGNGPRVRSARAFLTSFFAQPPSLDDPLCAEFAQEEVLQMLCTVLPEETAIILWYNKSRSTARICPSCRRIYRLGDVLPDLIGDDHQVGMKHTRAPQLSREQHISGLCSPVCFVLASFEYPGAIKTTWGLTAEEMDDRTWALLNGPGEGRGDMGLSMLVKMARLDDLGLGQLCLPGVELDFDEDEPSEPDSK
ncbi:hypothetical protein BJ138DRAFT_1009759 [Hygrophoropsis aurantiaca]|uniref:Uncharacterized protein n=1 Tax=Hygrophoropsis aurantiaca TaxID=72124 RepID=A0ACB8AA93_9AGAM|nr:hypothetical protein BJ138DRAFT_1009759 [Hygrophoropsis aurantiaca]